ncbi:hypothetical protein ABZ780_12510, partial [Micromonospora sp. NPDC047467]
MDAVYLYADMANSTGLARDFDPKTAAKVVRAYLDATCRVIKSRGGEIRSFDGDRVMAIFMGGSKNSNAARCALNINWAVTKVVWLALEQRLPSLKRKALLLGVLILSACDWRHSARRMPGQKSSRLIIIGT